MAFNCECRQCKGIFTAKRSTAKFCSDLCRKRFSRDKQDKIKGQIKKFSKKKGDLEKVKMEIDTTQEVQVETPSGFVPNWKRHGYKTKEEAMIKAIGDIAALGFPNTKIMWKGEYFILNPKDELSFKRVKKKR